MISATDAFPDTTPADQRHTQMVIGDHFSDIDEDEQEDEATSQSLDVGVDDEAQPRPDGVSVAHGMCDDTDAHMTSDVAAPVVDTDDAFSATDPPETLKPEATRLPASRWRPRPPMAGQSTRTAAPTATHMAAPLPLDMTRDPDADDTATAASATDTGFDIGADPNPATTGLLADEHISSFLRHIRRRADDKVAGLVLDAAPPDTGTGVAVDPAPAVAVPGVAAGPTTDMDVGTADGLLPGVADFDPASAWGGVDEVTTAMPDGADFDPTSLGSAWGDGDDATTGVKRGPGIGTSADDDFLAGVVDFDASLAWGDSDEVTAAVPSAADDATAVATGAAPTAAADVITTGVKRKRGHQKHAARNARKHQRQRLLAIHGSAPDTDTGSGVRRSDNTRDRAGPEGRGGWRCG